MNGEDVETSSKAEDRAPSTVQIAINWSGRRQISPGGGALSLLDVYDDDDDATGMQL